MHCAWLATLRHVHWPCRLLPVLLVLAQYSPLVASATNTSSSLAGSCRNYQMRFPDITCVHRYGSAMPQDFYRAVNYQAPDTYAETQVPGDLSFNYVLNATFLVWDQIRGQEVLGVDPTYEFMFQTQVGHEGPVYVPDTNELWFAQMGNQLLAEMVVDLNASPPTLSQRVFDPPVYAPGGARYRGGKVYLSAAGANDTLEGGPYRPGIYTVDPRTGKSTVEVNNYFGWYFNFVDDFDFDAQGRIWFTDPYFGREMGVNEVAPQVQASTYRYDPATGSTTIVDDTLWAPNGATFSPDKKTLYLTDTAAAVPLIDPSVSPQVVSARGLPYNSTNRRTLYAFDLSADGSYLVNRRPLYTAMDYAPDGLKVASNGYLLTASGHGVDILDTQGIPLVRIQTNFSAANIAFAGPQRDELWIVGSHAVARTKLNLTGLRED